MYELQTTDPDTWSFFASGGFTVFTVNTSNQIPFTREQQNKNLKGQGAISGITQSPATLLKFCTCAPELARIASEAEKMVGIVNQTRSVHHCLNQPTVLRQEWAIKNLHDVLAPCNIFTSNEQDMYKLMTKEIIPKSVKESILAFEKQGSSAMKSFVEERICGDSNLWDKIPKCKVIFWNATTKVLKLQAKSEVLTIRASAGLMSRLLIIARSSRQIDLEDVIGNYEFSVSNRVLMKLDGSVHPTVDKTSHKSVMSNRAGDVNTGVSSQEEADTLMILHATHAAKDGFSVHIMSPDTDVLLLALRRVRRLLGDNSVMIMGVGFLKASPSIITAISALGILLLVSEVSHLRRLSKAVCPFCAVSSVRKGSPSHSHTLLFKQHGTDKGVDMLPPTFGAWLEHIKRTHCQAAIWEQDLVLNPVVPDPTKLGWTKQDDRLVPELSKIAPAPAAVVKLVRCSCGASNPSAKNKCATGRCSCRVSALACTELCRCEAEADMCQNMNTNTVDPDDIE
ncbi:hypothetical protein GQR58_015421 [Nymphon striatum]|nr:hypothetical protein GQR58_015421 [Nymphon striatum]